MTILVTGATGNVGRLVVDELVAAGERVRALTVDPVRAALPPEAEVVVGSLAKPSTLPVALKGVDAVYLAPMARTVEKFTRLAREEGVRRVVALSGSSVGETHEMSSGHEFEAVEKAVRAAELDWTFLRPGAFMMNTFGWAGMVREGEVRTSYADARITPIDLGDIAAVAARTLVSDGHVGKTYELSGPAAVTQREQVEAIGAALGKEIAFVELSPDEHRREWTAQGMPEGIADWLVEGFARVAANPQVPTGEVERITGRSGMTYADWAVKNADAFR
ncbi:NAD(P)H-binding protein [Amycolatopsis sp. NPDC059021]|uniref:NAD(P)H-binding protein n=1 Tax=Amycolatopsis sp. NPDC059021 TaxID=3346704 RepID=UPI00366EE562